MKVIEKLWLAGSGVDKQGFRQQPAEEGRVRSRMGGQRIFTDLKVE